MKTLMIRFLPLFLVPVTSQAADYYCEARLSDRLAVGIRMDDRFGVDPAEEHYGPLHYTVYWDNFNRCETTKDGTMCTQAGVGGEIVKFRAKETQDGTALIPLATLAYEGMEEVPAPGRVSNFMDWKIGRRFRILLTDTGVKLVRGSKSVEMKCEAL